jgi:hypothetical protein
VKALSGTSADDLLERTLSSLPAALYRYYGVSSGRMEWIRRLVVDSDLYFTTSSTFNDPLDCRVACHFTSSDLTIEAFYRKSVWRPGMDRQKYKKRIQQLKAKARTARGRGELNADLFRAVDAYGMVSMTSLPASALMWAYYAEGHKGIVIRFRLNAQQTFQHPIIPIKVRYSEEFPHVNFYKASPQERIFSIIGTKAKPWEHEQEWRLVGDKGAGYSRIPGDMVDAVIFGLRTPEDCEAQIRRWVANRRPSIKLLRIRTKQDSFALEVVKAE